MRCARRATRISLAVWASGLALGGGAAGQQTLYVDDGAPAGGNGLSWATALNSLQDALQAPPPQTSEIRLAQGRYRPDTGGTATPGDRMATFALRTGLVIRGGFAGFGAPDPDLRDPALFPSVLSGDLLGDDGAGFVRRDDNSLHVVTAALTLETAALDGVTISGGYASGSGLHGSGACVLATDGAATISNCAFIDSQAITRAGGVAAFNSRVILTACRCTDLRGYQGGAVYASGGELRLVRCVLEGNAAQTGPGLLLSQTSAWLEDSLFSGHIRLPGASSVGGAVNASQTTLTAIGCTFEQNDGGGLGCQGPRLIVDRSAFIGNSGSGIDAGATSTTITRSTFAGNFGVAGAGVHFESSVPTGRALYAGQPAALNQWDGSAWASAFGGAAITGAIRALAQFNDGAGSALFVGGAFSGAGTPGTQGIARYDAGGFLSVSGGLNGEVHALAVYVDASGPALYAAGTFTTAGGVPANRIARWNGAAWSPLGAGADGPIESLTVSNGSLYAGGRFSVIGGVPASRIARWDGGSWSALGPGLDNAVLALGHATPGGGPILAAGGEFLASGPAPLLRLAGWNGTQWGSLGGGADAVVRALVDWDGGARLYACGDFISAGGVAASRIARWDGAGWSALGVGLNNRAHALAVYTDAGQTTALYVGGEFTTAGGAPAPRIARWNGVSWSALGAGQPGPVTAIAGYQKRQRTVRDCLFLGNDALGAPGGGVYGGDIIAGCVFSGNSAQDGGAVYATDGDIVNCTLVANTATNLGGGIYVPSSPVATMRVANSVVYFNRDRLGSLQDSQIYAATPSTRSVNFCCVENLTGSWGGSGNHWLNPLFVDRDGPDNISGTLDDDLHVGPLSPLLDRASIGLLPLALLADPDGRARLADGDGNGSALLDIGAYERPGPACYANCDGSTTTPVLNVNDFLCFQSRFAAGDPYANCDHSTVLPVLNVSDFICFLGAFAQGCP